jgi:nucleoside recognition membrane protein YjiH
MHSTVNRKDFLRFLIPSAFGVFIFLFPIRDGGTFNIPLGLVTDFFLTMLESALPVIVVLTMVLSTALTFVTKLFKPSFIMSKESWRDMFDVSPLWLTTRLLGTIFAIMTLYEFGWDVIKSDVTGQTMLGLMSSLIVWFFVGSYLLPYLTNFGAMEFVGTLLRNVVRPLFTLPGRSAIDLLASWVGNVNVGVVVTREQYMRGFYTGREAATIATCFSAVSLPFCLVIAGMLELDYMFPVFYGTVCLAGVISAIIVPRIPPLSRIPDTYYTDTQYSEKIPQGESKVKWGVLKAVERAKAAGTLRDQLKEGTNIFTGIALVLIPQAMGIGTLALIIAEFTPVFQYISAPMVPLLELFRIPEAQAAAPATLVGFIDMFIPAVLGSGIESELTRFVVGALSLVQIIYMTEMGTLLLISKIPLNLWRLALIFIERTIISLPVIVLIAHLLF